MQQSPDAPTADTNNSTILNYRLQIIDMMQQQHDLTLKCRMRLIRVRVENAALT